VVDRRAGVQHIRAAAGADWSRASRDHKHRSGCGADDRRRDRKCDRSQRPDRSLDDDNDDNDDNVDRADRSIADDNPDNDDSAGYDDGPGDHGSSADIDIALNDADRCRGRPLAMESMPYRDDLRVRPAMAPTAAPSVSTDWRSGLPVLGAPSVVLRELRDSDAAALFALLATEEVARFISPPPTTIEGFERFIAWTHRQRMAGAYVCFAVTIRGFDTAIGIIQVRAREADFSTAEWGFAIGSAFWGTGVFAASAELVVDFVFDVLESHRLEARAALQNGRGQGALMKLGAVKEGVLRSSLRRGDEILDQALFTILDEEWRARRERPAAALRVSIH
jgi:RimJ/RimL family protein N-acetyltransferase